MAYYCWFSSAGNLDFLQKNYITHRLQESNVGEEAGETVKENKKRDRESLKQKKLNEKDKFWKRVEKHFELPSISVVLDIRLTNSIIRREIEFAVNDDDDGDFWLNFGTVLTLSVWGKLDSAFSTTIWLSFQEIWRLVLHLVQFNPALPVDSTGLRLFCLF